MKPVFVKKFESFEYESDPLYEMGDETVNEAGLFDLLKGLFTKIWNLFKDPAKLKVSLDKAIEDAGTRSENLVPKDIKNNETVIVAMMDPASPDSTFSLSLTKLGMLSDGSGIFQVSGSDSPVLIKALAGSEKMEDLAKKSVMAVVKGAEKGKPLSMKLLRNILPNGKDYVTKTVVKGTVPSASVKIGSNTPPPASV